MTREMNLYVPEINAGRGAGCVIRIHFQEYRDLIFLKKPTVCGFETRRYSHPFPRAHSPARRVPFLILISFFRLNSFADVHRKWISASGTLLAEGRSAIENGRPNKDGLQRAYFRDVGREGGPRHVPVLRAERVRNGSRNCGIALRG